MPKQVVPDLIELLIHYILVCFCLRGNKEPRNIKIGHFKWSRSANNLKRVTLDGNETKTDKPTLTNHTLADGGEFHTKEEDPKNLHCVVKLIHFYLNKVCHPDQKDFFCHPAHKIRIK